MHCMSDVEVPDNVGRVGVEGGVVSQWLNEAACWCVSCRKDAVGVSSSSTYPKRAGRERRIKAWKQQWAVMGPLNPALWGLGENNAIT